MSLFFGRAVFCLENGRGVPQNYSEADRDYQRSALQENTNGQFRHVTCLHDGMDVAINGLEAAGYYKLAANQRRAGDRLGYAVWVEKCFRL
jgi:TPR repeat protein